MRALTIALLTFWACGAEAQVLTVQVRSGDVWVQQAQGWGRLTHDGRSTEATRSRDGSLVAYIHTERGREGLYAGRKITGRKRRILTDIEASTTSFGRWPQTHDSRTPALSPS